VSTTFQDTEIQKGIIRGYTASFHFCHHQNFVENVKIVDFTPKKKNKIKTNIRSNVFGICKKRNTDKNQGCARLTERDVGGGT
jgi:hypothetical protein